MTLLTTPRIHLVLAWAVLAHASGCIPESTNDGSQVELIAVADGIDSDQMLRDVANAFYAAHEDRYDMLVLWPSRALNTSAYYVPVANDIVGIGYGNSHEAGEIFDDGAAFGAENLSGLVQMGNAWPYTRTIGGHDSLLGLLGQETGHRWGASTHFMDEAGTERTSLVGAAGVHWSFWLDSGSSPLGGNDWTDVGDGRYRATPGELAYSDLDLYLMGLLAASDVGEIDLLVDVEGCPELECAMWGPTAVAIEVGARIEHVSVDQIIAAEGPRVPAANEAPSEFRQAWIYVYLEGEQPDEDDLDSLEEIRVTWEQHFSEATRGLGTMRTDLSSP